MKILYIILAMLVTGCSIGTISLQDNRSIEVKPHYINTAILQVYRCTLGDINNSTFVKWIVD